MFFIFLTTIINYIFEEIFEIVVTNDFLVCSGGQLL